MWGAAVKALPALQEAIRGVSSYALVSASRTECLTCVCSPRLECAAHYCEVPECPALPWHWVAAGLSLAGVLGFVLGRVSAARRQALLRVERGSGSSPQRVSIGTPPPKPLNPRIPRGGGVFRDADGAGTLCALPSGVGVPHTVQ